MRAHHRRIAHHALACWHRSLAMFIPSIFRYWCCMHASIVGKANNRYNRLNSSTEVSIHVHLTCFRFASTKRQWKLSLARPPQCRNRRTDEMFHFIIDHVVLLLLVDAHRMPSRIKNQKKNVFDIPRAFALFSFSLLSAQNYWTLWIYSFKSKEYWFTSYLSSNDTWYAPFFLIK